MANGQLKPRKEYNYQGAKYILSSLLLLVISYGPDIDDVGAF